MIQKPLVSIIIPVFNAAKYISSTIQSALDQTWPNTEILLIDDGSTDNSRSVLRKFESSKVKVYCQPNQGASAARNTGIKHSKGDYIQFLDADDLLSPNKIEAQLGILQNFPQHIGLCGTVYFNDGDKPNPKKVIHPGYSTGSDDPVDFLIKLYGDNLIEEGFGGMIQPNAWLTPRSLIEKAGPWNEDISLDDDGEYFCRVLLNSKGVKYTHDAINYYRKYRDQNNLSSKRTLKALKNMIKGSKLKSEYLLAHTNKPEAYMVLSRLLWENCFMCYMKYPSLANEAEIFARHLDPKFPYNPYTGGLNQTLAGYFGWKFVKIIQVLKHSALVLIGKRQGGIIGF